MKCTQTVSVCNAMGLHARPASAIARLLQDTRSEVTLEHNGQQANGRSIVEMLMLGARKNGEILLTVVGDDAEEVMSRLVEAFKTGLGTHI